MVTETAAYCWFMPIAGAERVRCIGADAALCVVVGADQKPESFS